MNDLTPLLDAPDRVTRAAAARALGKIENHCPDDRLRELARSDESVMVRGWASGALGEGRSLPVSRLLLLGLIAASIHLARKRR